MGLFDWLFGSGQPRSSRGHVTIGPSGDYDFEVVGESAYQEALDRICGGKTDDGHEWECTATLVEEPTNRHDPNAVKVTIDGHTVGYLSRPDAEAYRRALTLYGHTGKPVDVEAIILGGWERGRRGSGHYGVKLDMGMPPDFIVY